MMDKVIITGGRRSGKTAAMEALMEDADANQFVVNMDPPSRLSIEPGSPDFHPCCDRVGVRVNGIERNDLAFYDVAKLEYMTTSRRSRLADSIEPYWRYPESRQQRRARERWERKRR